MAKWHVGKNGRSRCPAKFMCRLKGPDGLAAKHFHCPKEADRYYDSMMAKEQEKVRTQSHRAYISDDERLFMKIEDKIKDTYVYQNAIESYESYYEDNGEKWKMWDEAGPDDRFEWINLEPGFDDLLEKYKDSD